MNCIKSAMTIFRSVSLCCPKVLLLSTLLLSTSAHSTFGQQPQSAAAKQLTAKYLIGDAVSLTNKSYPEVDKAIQRFLNNDASAGETFLTKAREKYPKLPPVEVMMAKVYVVGRNTQAALLYLEKATANNPDDPEAYLMLADNEFRSRKITTAQALYEYAAPLVEKFTSNNKRKRNFDIRVIAGRAAIAESRRQWEKAEGLLQQWIDADPENAVPYSRMGIVLFRLDKAKESLAAFKKAYEINPNTSHPFIALGKLFSVGGEIENARKSYEKAYNDNKSNSKIAEAYAQWLILQRDLDKAQEVATNLLGQDANSVTALLLDGIIAFMKEQPNRAEEALQKVLSLDPRNVQATDKLALLLIKSSNVADRERALQYAQLNAERLPNNALTIVTQAYVDYELGNRQKALQSLTKLKNASFPPDSTYLIAKILTGEKQNDRAKQALENLFKKKSSVMIFRREAEELMQQLAAEQ